VCQILVGKSNQGGGGGLNMHGDIRKTYNSLENFTRRHYLGGRDVEETVMVILCKNITGMAGLIRLRSRSRGGLL